MFNNKKSIHSTEKTQTGERTYDHKAAKKSIIYGVDGLDETINACAPSRYAHHKYAK